VGGGGDARRPQSGVRQQFGRQLICDAGLADRLAHIPCPFGDSKATERIDACLQRFLR
jgi:hypothetical protein